MRTEAIGSAELMRAILLSEVVLIVLSIVAGLVFHDVPFAFGFRLDPVDALMGALLALPPAFLVVLMYSRVGQAVRLVRDAGEAILSRMRALMGGALGSLRHHDIILISVLAGVGEEMFFRGLLQEWIGLVGASIVFGLLHALTLGYFVIATLIGLYLGVIYEASGNLLPAILTHALYDIFALYMLRRMLLSRS